MAGGFLVKSTAVKTVAKSNSDQESISKNTKQISFADEPMDIEVEKKKSDFVELKELHMPIDIVTIRPFCSPLKERILENKIHYLLLLNDCPVITSKKFNNLVKKLGHLLSKSIIRQYKKIYLTVDAGNNDRNKITDAIKIIESMFSVRSKEQRVINFWNDGGKIKIILF